MRIICVVLCLLGSCAAVIYRLSDEKHDLMPPVVHLDPYERCLRKSAGLYCSGFVNFVSDVPNSLLTQMQDYSEFTTRHFNYTRAFYGTCVSDKCKLERRTDPEHVLEACLNRTVWNDYKLKVKVEDGVYCIEENKNNSLDVAGLAMVVICLVLIVLNAIGSLYDIYVPRNKQSSVEYLLHCFSLRRNWRDLVASSDNSKDPRDVRLQGMHGIRAMSMILVVFAHAVMVPIVTTNSPLFFEKQYDILVAHLLMNGSLIMQTFLIMSSYLLMYTSLRAEESSTTTWMTLPRKIWKRWLRLTPAYAFVLATTATWLNNVGDGPLWDRFVTRESIHCRRDWWIHVLHLNNYFGSPHCMPQAWYLATDFQLYCLGMVIFVTCRSSKVRNRVLSTLFLIGMVIPGLHTYFQDLDAAVIVKPSAIAAAFADDPTFNTVYKRGHTNMPSYMLGLALGYFIYRVQKTNTEQNYKKLRPVYWTMVPVSFGLVLFCKLLYAEGPRMDVLYRTAIACCFRPTFGLTMAVVLGGTVLKIENVYRGILEWRGWSTIAKVSYSAYLVHVACIRTLGGILTTTTPGTYVSVLQTVLLMLVVTYLTAYMFHLTVEAPFNHLVKMFTDAKPKESVKTEDKQTKKSHKLQKSQDSLEQRASKSLRDS